MELVYGNLVKTQKKFNVNSPLAVYFGYNNSQLRLSFLSTTKPPKLEPTKYINIVQGPDKTGAFWLCFDVLLPDQENVVVMEFFMIT